MHHHAQLAILLSWCQINEGEQVPLGVNSGGVLKLPGLGKSLFLLEDVLGDCISKLMKNKLDLERRDLSHPVIPLAEKGFSRVLFSSGSRSATLLWGSQNRVPVRKTLILSKQTNKETPRPWMWKRRRLHWPESYSLLVLEHSAWSEWRISCEKCHPESCQKQKQEKSLDAFSLLVHKKSK